MQNKVAEYRKALRPRVSQAKLAKNVDICRPYLSEIERNNATPGGQVMLRIAKELGKTVEEVFFIDTVV